MEVDEARFNILVESSIEDRELPSWALEILRSDLTRWAQTIEWLIELRFVKMNKLLMEEMALTDDPDIAFITEVRRQKINSEMKKISSQVSKLERKLNEVNLLASPQTTELENSLKALIRGHRDGLITNEELWSAV